LERGGIAERGGSILMTENRIVLGHFDAGELFFNFLGYGFLLALTVLSGYGLRAIIIGRIQWKRGRFIYGTSARLIGLLCFVLGGALPVAVIVMVIRDS
jgi:hypothetical protein